MEAAALGQSERVMEIPSHVATGLATTADVFAKRFEKEMRAGRLTRAPSAKVRGRALVDFMQGLLVRTKAGVARERFLQDARSYVRPDFWRASLTPFLEICVWHEYHICHALTFRFWFSRPQMQRSRACRACELDHRLAPLDARNDPKAD